MQRFAPISKMESQPDGTIKVWGIASTESVDCDGEVIKADAMKAALPGYMEWGAIREMHQPIAAGTCLEASVNDEGQTVICAHVVDEGSVKKVKTGTLKGFSIGGQATKTDPMNKTIITELVLNEISLVDKPANPDAVISIWKRAKMDNPTQETPVTGEQVGNEIEALVKGGGLSLQEVLQAVRKAAAGKDLGFCMHKRAVGMTCADCEGGMAKMADDVDEFAKTDYSDDERSTMAANGEAEEDGSYPIKNEKDLDNAIHAYGRSKDKAKTKKHIIARAKALGLEDKIPEDWKSTEKVADNGDESGKGEGTEKGAVAPAGGSNEPAGDEGKEKAAKTGNGVQAVEKGAGNAEVPAVGTGTAGPANADNAQKGTAAQAVTPMLPKLAVGQLVTIKFGEDEVGGEIADIKELGDGTSVTIKNGDAHLAVDSSLLTHHELNGDKVHWTITHEDNAAFTAAKSATSTKVSAALCKMATGGAGKPIQKGMWTVGDWSDTLQRIVWLCQDIKWEAVAEDDPKDASLANKLAIWLREGAALWIEYAKDEINEMLTGVCDPDNVEGFLLELAAKPGELQKFAEGGTGVGHVLKKAFGAVAAGGAPDHVAIESAITKAVGAAVEQATAKLAKAHKEELDGLHAKIKELEDTPLPIKGVLKGTVVNKDSNLADNAETEVQPVMKNGKVDDVATEFKKALQNPQSFNRLATQ